MHILDLIMYFPIMYLIYLLIDKLSGSQYTTEIGAGIGCLILIVATIIYVVIFVIIDCNWIDIFCSIRDINFSKINW